MRFSSLVFNVFMTDKQQLGLEFCGRKTEAIL